MGNPVNDTQALSDMGAKRQDIPDPEIYLDAMDRLRITYTPKDERGIELCVEDSNRDSHTEWKPVDSGKELSPLDTYRDTREGHNPRRIHPISLYDMLAGCRLKNRCIVALETTEAIVEVPDGRGKEQRTKILVDGAFLRVKEGQMCAIMGASGCGKSVFLETLAGLRQTKSEFKIGFKLKDNDERETWDPAWDPVDGINKIAHVKQGDPLLADLDLNRSLRTRCRLMWPTMGKDAVDRMVAAVVKIGPTSQDDRKKWMSRRIGSSLDRDNTMSGGQRRRATIAHELLVHPMALLMDEPTSGLSASDALEVTEALKRHAEEKRVPVVMVIHQPSAQIYEKFEDLLLMASGGRVLFHGPRTHVFGVFLRRILPAPRSDKADSVNPLREIPKEHVNGIVFHAIESARRALDEQLATNDQADAMEGNMKRLRWTLDMLIMHHAEFDWKDEVQSGSPDWKDELQAGSPEMAEGRMGGKDCEFNVCMGKLKDWINRSESIEADTVRESLKPLEARLRMHRRWNENPAEFLTDLLAQMATNDGQFKRLGEMLREDPKASHGGHPAQDWFEVYRPAEEMNRPDERTQESHGSLTWGRRLLRLDRWVRIWLELVKRGISVLISHKEARRGLAFQLLQGPILAGLLFLAFRDHNIQRFGGLDMFASTARYVEAMERTNQSTTPEAVRDYQRTNWARVTMNTAVFPGMPVGGTDMTNVWTRRPTGEESKDPKYLDAHARHDSTVMFVVAFAVLWMAVVGGARELADDYPVIAHEAGLGVAPSAVLASRFMILWVISCWQSIPLVLVGGRLLEMPGLDWYGQAWFSMVCLGAFATATGLLVSAGCRSQRSALAIVPLVTVPQVLFAGVLQSFAPSSGVVTTAGQILPLRLGWESLLASSRFWTNHVMQFTWNGVNADPGTQGIWDTFGKSVKVREIGLDQLYFNGLTWGVRTQWAMLVGCAMLMGIAWWVLRYRIKRGLR